MRNHPHLQPVRQAVLAALQPSWSPKQRNLRLRHVLTQDYDANLVRVQLPLSARYYELTCMRDEGAPAANWAVRVMSGAQADSYVWTDAAAEAYAAWRATQGATSRTVQART